MSTQIDEKATQEFFCPVILIGDQWRENSVKEGGKRKGGRGYMLVVPL